MHINGCLKLEFSTTWVRHGGQGWCSVLRLVVLMSVMLLSTHA